MGFWHTGYIEFHESDFFERMGPKLLPAPPVHPCRHCRETFSSSEELRYHRFEAHPRRRPVLLLGDREIGTTRVTITRALQASNVRLDGSERAWLNSEEIPVSAVPEQLACSSSGVVRLVLRRDGVDASFELDFRLASEEDSCGIEKEFARMASGRRLSTQAVEDFITAVSGFGTAAGYYGGICAYLYGVLAKERAADSTLPYEAYAEKFNRAAEELAPYDRPLARTIGSLVEFHFNHFSDAARLSPVSRLGLAAARFATWIESLREPTLSPTPAFDRADIGVLLTDWDTERIIRWSIRPLPDLSMSADEIEEAVGSGLAEFDRVKLHVLLAEIHAASRSRERALEHAKALRNVPDLERWAEHMFRILSEGCDGRP